MWPHLFPSTCLGCGVLLRHDDCLALCSRCHPEQALLPPALADSHQVHARWDYDGPLARAVVALKFEGALALAGPLGRLLSDDPRLLVDARGRPHELVVPVPLHWRRRLARGFDQSEQLARWALRHAQLRARGQPPHLQPGIPKLARRLLLRTRATAPQTELDADARAANVSGAFVVRDPERVAGRRILVLDDVTTTGATAQACAAALLEAGASTVEAMALVRAL